MALDLNRTRVLIDGLGGLASKPPLTTPPVHSPTSYQSRVDETTRT